MAKLVLDTCSWLDLAKPRFKEVLDELENQVNSGITVLLISDIIVEEFEKHKEKILNEIIASIKTHASSALKMAEFLPEPDKSTLEGIVERYKIVETAQMELAKSHLSRVEKLLKGAKKYKITDALKAQMSDRALSKKAPFHNSKNNMADALLYFGAVSYVRDTADFPTDLFFFTLNHTEFCQPGNGTTLHSDLTAQGVHFYSNVAHALKMRKELVDEMDEYHEYQLQDWIDWQAENTREERAIEKFFGPNNVKD